MATKKTSTSTGAGKGKAPARKAAAKKATVKKTAVKKTAAAVKTPAPKPPAKQLDRHEIRHWINVAAYYKFVKRGYHHGEHIIDWYVAEKEIISDL